jgi:hypothetical protein
LLVHAWSMLRILCPCSLQFSFVWAWCEAASRQLSHYTYLYSKIVFTDHCILFELLDIKFAHMDTLASSFTCTRTKCTRRVVLFQDSKNKKNSKTAVATSNVEERALLPKDPIVKATEGEDGVDPGIEKIFLTWSQVPHVSSH